jgi:C-terminal processing protease CtpA/Prc
MKRLLILVVGLALTTAAGSQEPAPDRVDPRSVFDQAWTVLDQNYALFDAKGVDWKALYGVYRPQVKPETTDDELFEIMKQLLGHLNDNHIMLRSDEPGRFYCAGYLYQHFSGEGDGVGAYQSFLATMSTRPVPDEYFKDGLKEVSKGVFAYGWAAEGVGYFHFNRFSDMGESAKAIDTIVDAFKSARAVIIDVRKNQGGDDRAGKIIADRFADKKRLYMTTRDRVGPGYDDFAEPKVWNVEPTGPVQFTGPVYLLTDRTSISAAENFALAMKVLPHATQIGEMTSGCFADSTTVELLNGWKLSYSFNLFLDHEGRCWEGVGVPPAIRQLNSEGDLTSGRDRVFELALSLINAAKNRPATLGTQAR